MGTFPSGVLFGIVAVLALDAIGASLSQRLRFPYSRLSPISLCLWATSAAIASWGAISDPAKSLGLGWLSGFVVGLVDSTVGWWISWQLGAGRVSPELITTRRIAKIIFRVTMLAAGIGTIAVLLLLTAAKVIAQNTR
jgi:hypothetical protein